MCRVGAAQSFQQVGFLALPKGSVDPLRTWPQGPGLKSRTRSTWLLGGRGGRFKGTVLPLPQMRMDGARKS